MKRNLKKLSLLLLCLLLVVAMLAGCASGEEGAAPSQDADGSTPKPAPDASTPEPAPADDVTLELATTWTGDRKAALDAVLAEFTTESGITVEVTTPGDQFETVMKTRMGSQNLPDLWETHGWSVARYSEYLTPLNDQPWYSRIDESILPVITDGSGNIYVAPLTIGVNTITYSKDAFDAAGVKAADIRTWDDFDAACKKLLDVGITPIHFGNKDGEVAQLAEAIPPTYLTNEDVADNQADNLKNGTFDFDTYWTPISQQVSDWFDKGYFNVDILSAGAEAGAQEMGAGTVGMKFGGSGNIGTARTYNPDANLGILAVPSVAADGKSSLSMGEGNCYGIWKDTEHPEEAKQLLDYLARAETVSKLATASGDLPGFSDVENPDDYITQVFRETQDAFSGDLVYIPLFDREYMPSGMWDDLTNGFTEIFTSPGEAGVAASVKLLAEAYEAKMVQ